MKEDIPHIDFKAPINQDFGFEVMTISQISDSKKEHLHNPEQPHKLGFYILIFFTEGEGEHFIDFNWYPVQQNSLVYLTKDQINAFKFSDSLKGLCIIFNEDYFVQSFSHLPKDFIFRLFNPQLFSPVLQISEESDFKNYLLLLKKEYDKINVINKKTITESLLVILLSKAESHSQAQSFYSLDSPKISIFQKFNNLLAEKFTESRSAVFYSDELSISYKHLNTICKSLIHKTAKNVIDDFIILQAKRSLINSPIKSTELAYSLGFEDPTNFTKYFKNHTGLTPNSFKNSYSK